MTYLSISLPSVFWCSGAFPQRDTNIYCGAILVFVALKETRIVKTI